MTIWVYEMGGTGIIIRGYDFGNWPWTPESLEPGQVTLVTNLGFNMNFECGLVWYPAQALPMGPSVDEGISLLTEAVNTYSPNPGDQFVLMGISQGAMVCSKFYDSWRTGPRADDLVAGIMFGNPAREAGHTFPGCPDPGGHGIWEWRLTDTEDKWWEFALPGDPATTQGDDIVGQVSTDIFEWMQADWAGGLEYLDQVVLTHPLEDISLLDPFFDIVSLAEILYKDIYELATVHLTYGSPTRTIIPGDPRSCYEIAVDYINSLAPADDSTAINPTVPMPVATGWSSQPVH
ncbi:PE-PPE domain-containing protein [Mycobacterium malmoense]|uniref:PE-PPE domain-containing protein n=1 Tax=Mycobacterium malmoense TaxID=1780 RepID=A0ABX3SPC6_MYCMA|nr:PE-PPE domain-containing protein [Mycobacterium malmoense]OIN79034.1 hypothetical protein BMG05_20070 [Mycobacterium malmoense]ORA79463.1 hypothetical protein BST29_19190 [Mycobacterium malmoense]QZA16810.1 PE-PPE domain-containing protein [Mycobacterium malmoense]UNB93604.1 PE-PPE domain-containing protein [Mycobacterium malmoense]